MTELTANELAALRAVEDGDGLSIYNTEVFDALEKQGLLASDSYGVEKHVRSFAMLTDAGRAALADHDNTQPVTPLPSAAGDNTRVLCDWCGQQPAVHGGECDDCWRLPGHEGEGAESAEVVELRAENKRLHTLIQLALINAPYDEPLNIKTPKLLLAQAWAFWELRQRILLSNQALATHDHAANG